MCGCKLHAFAKKKKSGYKEMKYHSIYLQTHFISARQNAQLQTLTSSDPFVSSSSQMLTDTH